LASIPPDKGHNNKLIRPTNTTYKTRLILCLKCICHHKISWDTCVSGSLIPTEKGVNKELGNNNKAKINHISTYQQHITKQGLSFWKNVLATNNYLWIKNYN
jgi:hypothetical protein